VEPGLAPITLSYGGRQKTIYLFPSITQNQFLQEIEEAFDIKFNLEYDCGSAGCEREDCCLLVGFIQHTIILPFYLFLPYMSKLYLGVKENDVYSSQWPPIDIFPLCTYPLRVERSPTNVIQFKQILNGDHGAVEELISSLHRKGYAALRMKKEYYLAMKEVYEMAETLFFGLGLDEKKKD